MHEPTVHKAPCMTDTVSKTHLLELIHNCFDNEYIHEVLHQEDFEEQETSNNWKHSQWLIVKIKVTGFGFQAPGKNSNPFF